MAAEYAESCRVRSRRTAAVSPKSGSGTKRAAVASTYARSQGDALATFPSARRIAACASRQRASFMLWLMSGP